METYLTNLVSDIVDELRIQGISVTHHILVKPVIGDDAPILTGNTFSGLSAEYHATWCTSTDDDHMSPCEGEWDIPALVGADPDFCPMTRLTMAGGTDGTIYIETYWKVSYPDILRNDPGYDDMVTDYLNTCVSRVLATIRHDQAHKAQFAL